MRLRARLVILLCFFAFIGLMISVAEAAPPKVTLKAAELKDFSSVPAPRLKTEVRPEFKEAAFPLEKASNFKEVEEIVGRLTREQRASLQKNRFLLLPKRDLHAFPSMGQYDEMLSNFEGIGGPWDPAYREPWNARFVGPDVFLHALHTFFSKRLEAIEGGELLGAVQYMLEELYSNAGALRATASKQSAPHWERLQAQLVVPLVLSLNCEESAEPVWAPPDADLEPDIDTIGNALELFKKYSRPFSKRTSEAIITELKRIYAAEEALPGLLGLSPAYASQSVDYTQFTPRGHYEKNSRNRAYFRAMIRLGQLGWKPGSETGAVDALNFALAMSYGGKKTATQRLQRTVEAPEIPFQSPLEAWKRVMEVSCFFVGYPDAASYPEWRRLLLEKSGVSSFTPDTCTDASVVERIRKASAHLAPSIPHFKSLFVPGSTETLCIFPQRFTIPWLITEELTYKQGVCEDVPVLFSSLWVAAVVGNEYARWLVPKQVPLSLAGLPAATAEGAPATGKGDPVPPDLLNHVTKAMPLRIEALARRLANEPETAWFSSIGSSWMWLLSTLVSEYGKGYPLYMQGPLFSAKQLETQLGSYTELRHDTILYEKPNYAEMGDGGEEEPPAPLPRGFIEPNLPFWNEMIRVVAYIRNGFEKNGLFPLDTEEYGALTRFSETLDRCAKLAEKVLRGKTLTEEEYEFLRLFPLDYMAAPADGYGSVVSDELFQSALIVDIQTVNLDPGAVVSSAILYQATAEPSVMLVLVGNENAPRVAVGMAYDHREFTAPHGRRLTDSLWKKRVYGKYDENDPKDLPLPVKNFWYDGLRP
jgi:hypothetical protein